MYVRDKNLSRVLQTYANFWDDNETGGGDNNDAISLAASMLAKLFGISEHVLNQHMIDVITNKETPRVLWGYTLLVAIRDR